MLLFALLVSYVDVYISSLKLSPKLYLYRSQTKWHYYCPIVKTGILLVFLSCTYTIHIAHSLSLRRAMPLSYLYVYDLCFSISGPSGGDVSAKVRKFFIPASGSENSFSRSAHPDLCRSLRSVPLSALRVQRYNFSHFLQAPSRKYFTKIQQVADLQYERNTHFTQYQTPRRPMLKTHSPSALH